MASCCPQPCSSSGRPAAAAAAPARLPPAPPSSSSISSSGSRRRQQSAACSALPGSSSRQGPQQDARSVLRAPAAALSSQPSTLEAAAEADDAAAACSCAATPVAPTGWHHLDHPSIWKGTEEQAVFRQATPYPLSPTWKVMLLSDGSVTRHLQLLTNQRVEVECLEQRNIGHERAGLPPATAQIPGPLVQRQVMLHIPQHTPKPYVYATSWWNADTVDQYLRDRSQPIWVSLSQGRAELYRDILQLELGNSPHLQEQFQAEGPFWGRQYLFWHNQEPLTLVYEVFSPALEEFLGPPRQA